MLKLFELCKQIKLFRESERIFDSSKDYGVKDYFVQKTLVRSCLVA